MRKLKKLRCRYHYSLEGKFPLAIKSVDFVRVYKDECENCVQTDYGFLFRYDISNGFIPIETEWHHVESNGFIVETNGFKPSKTRNPNFEYTR